MQEDSAGAESTSREDLLSLTAHLVSAYVSKNPVPMASLPGLVGQIHDSLAALKPKVAEPVVPQTPAVAVKRSITPDHLICLDCGGKFRSLKRHLGTHHGLTPGEYRQKWGLAADYPMVAPNYAATRSELAKKMGLGRKAAPAKRSRGRAGK